LRAGGDGGLAHGHRVRRCHAVLRRQPGSAHSGRQLNRPCAPASLRHNRRPCDGDGRRWHGTRFRTVACLPSIPFDGRRMGLPFDDGRSHNPRPMLREISRTRGIARAATGRDISIVTRRTRTDEPPRAPTDPQAATSGPTSQAQGRATPVATLRCNDPELFMATLRISSFKYAAARSAAPSRRSVAALRSCPGSAPAPSGTSCWSSCITSAAASRP
jgi:hypothetical protein